MSQTYSRSEDNVDLPEQEFAGLRRLRADIERDGGNLDDNTFARAQALLAASDLLALGTAVKAAGGAAMTLASMLMFNDDVVPPGFTRFELNHPDGTQAVVEVSFQPEGSLESTSAVVDAPSETSTSNTPGSDEKRLWVTNDNLDAGEVEVAIQKLTDATQESPGSLPVVVGAGAFVALVQALDFMNAATGNYRLQGLGSDDGDRWDVEVIASVQPAPKMVRRPTP